MKPLLQNEKWFHGPITRTFSESLLKNDGDFLVRESQNTRGQFVLTGLKSGHFHHLLLIDKDGCIRTKDRQFDSISHLINYHWSNFLPIISSESALLLQTPVLRNAEIKKWELVVATTIWEFYSSFFGKFEVYQKNRNPFGNLGFEYYRIFNSALWRLNKLNKTHS